MKKKFSLLLVFVVVFTISLWLARFSGMHSMRGQVIKDLFPQTPTSATEWEFEGKKWHYFIELKSLAFKAVSWSILKSEELTPGTQNVMYTLVKLKTEKAEFASKDFLNQDKSITPRFDIRLLDKETEGVFYIDKKCRADFCEEFLRVIAMTPDEVFDAGKIPLSASNLVECKKLNQPCYEFTGSYAVEKNIPNAPAMIKVVFTGFEEDKDGKSKNIEGEIYHYKDHHFISESFAKYH